mgnify:CR=1 FL=1
MEKKKLTNVIEEYFDRLWPINRSIVSPGFRESLDILSEIIPFKRQTYKTGEKIFDWTVPKEWKVNKAYIIDPNGKKRCDFEVNNLHLVSHSSSYRGELSLEKLKEYLHSYPELPNGVPYLTSFFDKRWGFCISDEELKSLPEGKYKIVVDTELYDGELTTADYVLKGEYPNEIMFTSYLCHPSMANNELSGPLTLAFLYDRLKNLPNRKYSYRFVVMPETLGTICYLSKKFQEIKKNIIAGYVLTCLGLGNSFTYKCSRQDNSRGDRLIKRLLKKNNTNKIIPFTPIAGSDERQFCSPGFDLPVGSLMRKRYLEYPEYHSSLDNKELISFDAIEGAVNFCMNIIDDFETNLIFKNTVMNGEPRLGNKGLYPKFSSNQYFDEKLNAILWILNLSDGNHDIKDIEERTGYTQKVLLEATSELERVKLLERI